MIKDYDCTINYHPGKANVVADALSRKDRLKLIIAQEELRRDFEKMRIDVGYKEDREEFLQLTSVQPTLVGKIKKAQSKYPEDRNRLIQKEGNKCQLNSDGILKFGNRRWIPQDEELQREILQEAHSSKFSGGRPLFSGMVMLQEMGLQI